MGVLDGDHMAVVMYRTLDGLGTITTDLAMVLVCKTNPYWHFKRNLPNLMDYVRKGSRWVDGELVDIDPPEVLEARRKADNSPDFVELQRTYLEVHHTRFRSRGSAPWPL